ncbi:hypothetical protein [Bacillus toyonensis]|uniref:hypothetical protein n=1 Tax=Bacillus toyonensis TaxID=155322 RepID=UPI002E1F46A8|nr:hypothetical protein [Bacillus toyonensis]
MKNLQPILKEITKHDDEFTVIFFLGVNEYGYAYTYVSDDKVCTMMLEDRFSKKEITSKNLDNMIGEENRQGQIGKHDNNADALREILNFWSEGDVGKIDKASNMKEAVEIGRKLKLDFIII